MVFDFDFVLCGDGERGGLMVNVGSFVVRLLTVVVLGFGLGLHLRDGVGHWTTMTCLAGWGWHAGTTQVVQRGCGVGRLVCR